MSIDLTNKTELLEYLKSNSLWAKHGLGQNFLVDRDALNKIIHAADLGQDDLVIEVGPGLGTLTEELIEKAGKVAAVEIDDKLAELLASKYRIAVSQPTLLNHDSKLLVLNSDILKINIPELVGDRKYKVIANIPYYITSKIIKLFLTTPNKPKSIVLLVQKEVAERICAKPGDMSVLALSVQAYGKPEIIGIVPRESFFPSPDVDSAILKISDINYVLSETSEDVLFRAIKVGFSSRRKTLVNNLSSGYHIDKKNAADIIKSIGLSENVRAQELSLEEWVSLTKAINDK
jgi:16S rRNA (adenine1518-N6/adenine1519-N6)-dimethyltransferase